MNYQRTSGGVLAPKSGLSRPLYAPVARSRSRRPLGPPLCSTTFGGSTVPPLFGGGGPPPPFGGYVFSSFSQLFFGNSNAVGNPARTLAVSANPGDLIVAFTGAGPGYAGQSSVTLRTPTFAVWSSTGGILQFDAGVSRFVMGIQPRIATGTSEDNCLMFSAGPFPIYLGCAVFGGNPWAGSLATITADNENSQINNDNANNIFRENCPTAGQVITLKTFAVCKQTSAAESGASISNTDQSIIALGLQNCGDNGFSQGMIYGCGYKFEEFAVDTATGNYPLSSTWTGDSFSLSCTFKSGDS